MVEKDRYNFLARKIHFMMEVNDFQRFDDVLDGKKVRDCLYKLQKREKVFQMQKKVFLSVSNNICLIIIRVK